MIHIQTHTITRIDTYIHTYTHHTYTHTVFTDCSNLAISCEARAPLKQGYTPVKPGSPCSPLKQGGSPLKPGYTGESRRKTTKTSSTNPTPPVSHASGWPSFSQSSPWQLHPDLPDKWTPHSTQPARCPKYSPPGWNSFNRSRYHLPSLTLSTSLSFTQPSLLMCLSDAGEPDLDPLPWLPADQSSYPVYLTFKIPRPKLAPTWQADNAEAHVYHEFPDFRPAFTPTSHPMFRPLVWPLLIDLPHLTNLPPSLAYAPPSLISPKNPEPSLSVVV